MSPWQHRPFLLIAPAQPGALHAVFAPAEPQCRGQRCLCKIHFCQKSLQDVRTPPLAAPGDRCEQGSAVTLPEQEPGHSTGVVAPPGGTWSFTGEQELSQHCPELHPLAQSEFPTLQEGSRAQELRSMMPRDPSQLGIFCDAQISPSLLG